MSSTTAFNVCQRNVSADAAVAAHRPGAHLVVDGPESHGREKDDRRRQQIRRRFVAHRQQQDANQPQRREGRRVAERAIKAALARSARHRQQLVGATNGARGIDRPVEQRQRDDDGDQRPAGKAAQRIAKVAQHEQRDRHRANGIDQMVA